MNKSQNIFLVSLLGLVLVGVGLVTIIGLTKPAEIPSASADAEPVVLKVKAYAMTDVATHANKESCWTAIDGNVYDLSGWISKHPGGEKAILGICGVDGTSTFRRMHKSNPKQENILTGFLIGFLSK